MSAIDELMAKINYVCINGNKREIYKKLKSSIIFENTRGYPDIFLLALALGIRHGKRKTLKKSSGFFRVYELGNDIWMLLSIGCENNLGENVFESKEGIKMALKICEEYANDGIDILNDMFTHNKEPILSFIEEIIDLQKK